MKRKSIFVMLIAVLMLGCPNPIKESSHVYGEWELVGEWGTETWLITEKSIKYTSKSDFDDFGYEGLIVRGSSNSFNAGDKYISADLSDHIDYADKGFAVLEVENEEGDTVYRVFRWASFDYQQYFFTQAAYQVEEGNPDDEFDFGIWSEEFETIKEALNATADAEKAEKKGLIFAFSFASSGATKKK